MPRYDANFDIKSFGIIQYCCALKKKMARVIANNILLNGVMLNGIESLSCRDLIMIVSDSSSYLVYVCLMYDLNTSPIFARLRLAGDPTKSSMEPPYSVFKDHVAGSI